MTKKNRRLIVLFISLLSIVFLCFAVMALNNVGDNFVVNSNSSTLGEQRNDSLEFIYMDKSQVDVGEKESVYVSFYNEDYAKNSSLTFHKEDCKEQTVKPTKVVDEVALYEMSFEQKEDIGKYVFDRISWNTKDAGYQNIDKSEKGYAFAVSAQIDSYDSDELPFEVYNLNNDTFEPLQNADFSANNIFASKDAMNLNSQYGLNICLDPGHGGNESGASYGGLQEKNVNLRIAQACRDQLRKYPGINVSMTRDGDWDVGLQQRADIARNNGADLFISFHNNAGGGTGSEVWVQYGGCSWHNEFNSIGTDIANRILDKLCNKMGLSYRGVKSEMWDGRRYPDGAVGDNFAVLYWTRNYGIPGILVEHAFMDTDWAFLSNDANLVQMGRYDAEAIAEYYQFDAYGPSDILSGTYKIDTALSSNKVLDVVGKSKENEARLHVINDDSSSSQRWKVETNDNNWVTIQNVNSGKYLDIYGQSVFDKAIIQQYENNNGDNQKWKIINVGNSYKIVSKLNPSYVLDIPGGNLDSSNYLIMYSDNGGKNQLFDFTIDIPGSDSNIQDGYYTFSSFNKSQQVIKVRNTSLEDGAIIETNSRNDNSPDQIFKVEKVGKYHRISNAVTDKPLDVAHQYTSIGNLLQQWTQNGGNNQLWSIQKQADGSYCFYCACNGLCIDCYAGQIVSGNPICTYNYTGHNNQKWSLNKVNDPYKMLDELAAKHINDIKDGIYQISTDLNSNLVLDVYQGSTANAANVQLYSNNKGLNQQWSIIHDNKGYVTIVNENSTKYLDIYGGSKQDNINVIQYEKTNGANQKWIIIKESDTQYKIMSATIYNNYLTCSSNKPENETNILAKYNRDNSTQVFNFKRLNADVEPSDPAFKDGYYKMFNNSSSILCADLEGSNIDDGGQVLLWTNNSVSMNQEFQFIKYGNYHRIKSVVSDKYLTFNSQKRIVQQTLTDDASQSWSVQNRDGTYRLVNVKNGYVLDVLNQRATQGAYLDVYYESSSNTQKWNLVAQEDPFESVKQLAKKHAKTIEDGLYSITLAASNNYAIDVYAASKEPECNVQLYNNNSQSNQKWRVRNDEATGYVMLENENSGDYLDISGGLKQINTNVCQYFNNDGLNQKWIIIKDGDSYKIHSAMLLNYYLVAESYPVKNETNICATYGANSNQQKFNFTVAQPTPQGTPICYGPRTTVQKMMNYFNSTGHTYPSWYRDHGYGGDYLQDFCSIIVEESIYEGVDPAVVFCQAMKETGWLTFTGDVSIDQCNFCGLGATGGGEPGCSFKKYGENAVRMGIRAQVQHLKRYAVGTLKRPGDPVDPRFDLPEPGCAPTVEQLGGHWASSSTYGIEIVNMMRNCY